MEKNAATGPLNASDTKFLTTEAAAKRLGLRPQTLRAAVCRDGHYGGAIPCKRSNRMLGWSAEQIDRIAAGLTAIAGGA